MKSNTHKITPGLVVFLLALIGSAANAIPPGNLAFTPSNNGGGGWGPPNYGIDHRFQVFAPKQVTALAYFKYPPFQWVHSSHNGQQTTGSLMVSIMDVTLGEPGQTIASAVIHESNPVCNVSRDVDFLYQEITPVTLIPGKSYQIVESQHTFVVSVYVPPVVIVDQDILTWGSHVFGGNFFSVSNVFGDLSDDGIVDGADMGLLLLDFGPCGGCPSDLDGDGYVDGADVGLLLLSFT